MRGCQREEEEGGLEKEERGRVRMTEKSRVRKSVAPNKPLCAKENENENENDRLPNNFRTALRQTLLFHFSLVLDPSIIIMLMPAAP